MLQLQLLPGSAKQQPLTRRRLLQLQLMLLPLLLLLLPLTKAWLLQLQQVDLLLSGKGN